MNKSTYLHPSEPRTSKRSYINHSRGSNMLKDSPKSRRHDSRNEQLSKITDFKAHFMRRDDLVYLVEDQKNAARIFKMTKTRTAMFLVMIVSTCALLFSITDAYPTPDPDIPEDLRLGNNSRLVITHVVKTIEFEVGVMDDDGVESENENSTFDSSNDSQFYETNIQLLNLDLLREVVNKADEEETKSSTETAVSQDKAEEQDIQMNTKTTDKMEESTS